MRILFIFARPGGYDSQSVREKPSGGTEKAVIFLGEALQKLGHEVMWITSPEQWRALHQLGVDLNTPEIHRLNPPSWTKPDVVITQVAELLEYFPNAKKIWWTHHFADQPVIQANAAFARCFADRVVTLSRCHADDFKTKLRLDSVTIGHGVWLDELDTSTSKDPYRLIYASTPFRGLDQIPRLFRAIKEREPRATIAICSSMGTYGEPEKDAQYQKIFDELAEIPGVELKGSLNQAQLYAEYSRASIFCYPCTWPETYCLALDEAIAHGCMPWVSNIGALPERACWTDFNFPNQVYHGINRVPTTGLPPKDWLEIAQQWEREVLNG